MTMVHLLICLSLVLAAPSETPPASTEQSSISAEIEGLDDFKASNVNGNYMSFSNLLTLKASTRKFGEDDGRSMSLKVTSFEGEPARFVSPKDVISIEFEGLKSEHGGSRFKLNKDLEAPGNIVVESYADKRISGSFEAHLLNRDGQKLHLTNGRFQNVKLMEM
jgi:hypothetical protein